jgi:hypothetical protein
MIAPSVPDASDRTAVAWDGLDATGPTRGAGARRLPMSGPTAWLAGGRLHLGPATGWTNAAGAAAGR